MPALFTRMSIGPTSFSIFATAASMAALSVTSNGAATAFVPIAFTAASTAAASRPLIEHARARRHVAFRDGAADAAAGAGDEREAAGEIEQLVHGRFLRQGGEATDVEWRG